MTVQETLVRLANLKEEQDRTWVQGLVAHYATDPMGLGEPLVETALASLIQGLDSQPNGLQFLAFRGQAPVGLAVCFLGFSTFAGRPLLNIHDLVVLPEARRCGIATSLMSAAEAHARKLGCCKVTLEVRADNHPAKTLYGALGFGSGEPGFEFWTKPL